DAGADDAGDQVTDPARELDTEDRKQGVGDNGADNAQNDVHEKPLIGPHQLLGNPTGETADHDCPYPTYTFHSDLQSRYGRWVNASKSSLDASTHVGLISSDNKTITSLG